MIVSAGENVADLIQQPDGNYLPVPGGSALNIAVALGRLGVKAGYAMPISQDALGDLLARTLADDGVEYLPAARVQRLTGLALVSVRDGQPSYGFYRTGVADTDLEEGDLPELGSACELLHTGGSPSLGHPVCGPQLLEWTLERPAGIPVSIDPNVRPVLIPDKDAFLERIVRLAASGCLIFRLSDEDADYMYGTQDSDDVCMRLLDHGAALAVFTRGTSGAVLRTARHKAEVPVRPVELADAVGAGDTFLAALLAKLGTVCGYGREAVEGLAEDELKQLGAYAAAAAAINCSRSGCQPPTAAEVERLLGN